MRTIVTPPALSPVALAEIKDWLGVTTTRDDTALLRLLEAALESCEAFTGSIPLACTCEETFRPGRDWTVLASRPVQSITGLWTLSVSGARTALALASYAIDLDADGRGLVRVTDSTATSRCVVRFTAGIAASWDDLPDGLRHGVLRLAAEQYQIREPASQFTVPSAAIAALWRPWRRARLA